MKKPKISIITVCYNSEAHIEEAILSVINQSYENKEYLVIDGGSTDGTLSIIEKYRDKIDYFVSEPDKGISDAFNKGIRAATGDIVGICNSDDVMADDVLNKIALSYDPAIDIFRLNEVTKDFETCEEYLFKPTIHFPVVPYNVHILHMGCYISRHAYEKWGLYDTEFKYAMDLELLRRFMHNGAAQKYIPEVVGYFRKGGASGARIGKQSNEHRQIVLRYGGNKLQAECYVAFLYAKQLAKDLLNLFGKNVATKLKSRYSDHD